MLPKQPPELLSKKPEATTSLKPSPGGQLAESDFSSDDLVECRALE